METSHRVLLVSRYINLSYEISAMHCVYVALLYRLWSCWSQDISICRMIFQPCILSTNIHHSLRNFIAKCVSIVFNEHFKNECFDDGKEPLSTGVKRARVTAIARYDNWKYHRSIPCKSILRLNKKFPSLLVEDIKCYKEGTVCPSVNCPGEHCTLVQSVRGD